MEKRSREGKIQSVEALLEQAMPARYDAIEKLGKAARAWESIVGPILGKQSVPLDIVNGELIVAAEGPLVGNQLVMMRGNIARALTERWRLEVAKVKVVVGRLPLKTAPASGSSGRSTSPASVRVREEDVKEFSSRCLECLPDFPEDAAESLARLRAFFIKRFGKK